MRTNRLLIACTLAGLIGLMQPVRAITVHTVGDSTMAEQNEETTEQRGWAQMLQQFFGNGATINNRGKSGASSKSFYLEAPYWATVKTQIEAGDYVLIQFAHNDEKNNGLDGDTVIARTGDSSIDYRGTTAQGTYKLYLRKYVEDTRALGATPILVAPMCRKYFTDGTIRRNGRHDLGDKFHVINDDNTISESSVPADDHTYDYPYAMRQVAAEMGVPFIDLTTASADLYEEYGETYCTDMMFLPNDGTHTNALGATLIARLAVQLLAAQDILTDYLNLSADLLVNPATIDFGDMYIGQTVSRELTVSGFDLTPSDGTFQVGAGAGFELSPDKAAWTSTLELPYTGGNLTFTRLYVRHCPEEAGTFTGTITFDNGTINKTVSLAGNAVQITGGEPVLLRWELESNAEATLTDPATVIDESWNGMYVQKYSAPNTNTTWPEESGYTTGRKTQRNLIEGDNWPANEIDEVSTRYIQFGIQANPSTELHIDSIGLYVGGAGGNGMRCRIWYATNDNFEDAQVLADHSGSMVSNTMYAVSGTPVIKLGEGQKLLLRIYPWYNSSSVASGKTICLSSVTIRGTATSAGITALGGIEGQAARIVSEEYYALDGRRLGAAPQHGIYISRALLEDGSIRTQKNIR